MGHTRVLGGPLAALAGATFLSLINYAALIPVLPMWAAERGADAFAAGTITSGMMAATVAAQFLMPWLMRFAPLRSLLIAGTLLLGAPTPLYLVSDGFTWLMVITLVRGLGFGLVVVTGGVLAADLAPEGRLSSAVALYGFATASPTVVGLAGGVWASEHFGFGAVFWTATATSLSACAIALLIPGALHGRFTLPSLRSLRAVSVPIVLLVLTGSAFGAVTTFLPLSGPDPVAAALALLLASLALVLGRVAVGPFADRIGSGRIQYGAALSVAAGLGLIGGALDGGLPQLLIGSVLLGAGFGACQNDTFVATVDRMSDRGTGTASTLWNIGYDGGLGLGAFVLGAAIGALGTQQAILALAAVIGGAAAIAWLAASLRRAVPDRGQRTPRDQRTQGGDARRR
ncbi:MFS transporter [Leucobacter sp. Psy1]|uniref:MFS transporter n=1 Tax=Leucobacter sp. Psy1 TaxID=2875729 RepID=UPI001CD6B846|nr:MFS transporter [Leucobacter sp. Psy1]UBH06161.1 MFS transporter [Leucobacter sp. Psy1]